MGPITEGDKIMKNQNDTIYVLKTDWEGTVGYYLPTVVPTDSQKSTIKFFANELTNAKFFDFTEEAIESYQELWYYDVFNTNRVTY